ncbi:unnamed protein product [Closterium sp. NIES-64]|nr:unnamed protein product [Closterium sp. NIES-64]
MRYTSAGWRSPSPPWGPLALPRSLTSPFGVPSRSAAFWHSPRALPRLSAALPFRAPPAPSLPAPALCLSSRCCLLLLLNSCVSPPAVCTSLLLLCRPLSTRPLLCFHLRVYHRVLVSASLRSSCCSCCLPLVIIACNYAAGRERAGERVSCTAETNFLLSAYSLGQLLLRKRTRASRPGVAGLGSTVGERPLRRKGRGADGKTRVNMKKGNERVGQPEDAGGLRTFGGAFEEILARVTSELQRRLVGGGWCGANADGMVCCCLHVQDALIGVWFVALLRAPVAGAREVLRSVGAWRPFYSHNGTGAGGCTVGCGGRVFGGRVCVRACGGLGRECTSGGECVLQLHASAETDKGVEGATLAVGMGGWAQARMGARRRWAHGAGGRTARLGARRGWAHGAVGRTLDGRTLDGRTLDGRTLDGRTLDGRTLDGRTLDGRTLDGRTLDGRTLDGRTLDGHTSDGRTLDGRTLDGRMADGRMADGPMADGPMADGPMADGHSADCVYQVCTSAGTTTGCTGFDTRQQSLHVDEISWWDAWERDTGAAGRMADECLGGVAAGVGADGRGGGHVASAPARATAGSWAAWDHWAMWSGCRWDERENDDRVEFMHELVVVVCTSAAMHVL